MSKKKLPYKKKIKEFITSNLQLLILIILFLLSIFFMFAGSSEPVIKIIKGTALEPWLYKMHIGNSIVFGVATGMFSGVFIWFLAVYMPERKKRNMLKNSLSYHYRAFKENVIGILLYGVKDRGIFIYCDLEKTLCDHCEFRKFFKYNDSERWSDVIRFLVENNDYFRDILGEMEQFSRELVYVRNNCNIQDELIDIFLNKLSQMLDNFKHYNINSDGDLRPFMQFLWSIFTQWNMIDGQMDEDPIQGMIDKI